MGAGTNTSAGDAVGSLNEYYRAPIPDIVTKYKQNLGKQGFLDLPSFNELFSSYRQLGEREANRNAAAINEAFGSQGARYSSDLVNAQGRMRENFFDQLMNKAAEYQMGLRQQQSQEVAGIANLEYGANEAAMARFFNDFLRRTSPPPFLQAAISQSQSYGLPPTVV